jgi:hypothetical protein
LTLDLLIEQCGYPARYASEGEISVRPEISHNEPRLVEGTDQQPLHRSAAPLQPRVAGPVPHRTRQKSEHGIHHGLLVAGNSRQPRQPKGQSSDAFRLLCSCLLTPNQAEQNGDT